MNLLSVQAAQEAAADPEIDGATRAFFDTEYGRVARRVDSMFVMLILAQWAIAILLSVTISPVTWFGVRSAPHLHVWSAVFLGGALSLFPVYMARRAPGELRTRMTIALAQMSWSALLIHLTGGRIETHFHVFGSLALLAFYRDLRVLAPATLIVVVDHFARGMLWPESIYGVSNPAWWRFLEHAGWVVFIDVFLIRNTKQSRDELWSLCLREVLTIRATMQAAELREQAARAEERERAMQEREGAVKMEAIGQLAAGIAHEINTPIQYVGDNAVFLRRAMERLFGAMDATEALLARHAEGEVSDEDFSTIARALKKAKLDYLRREIPKSIEQSLEGLDRVKSIVGAMKDFSHPSQGQYDDVDLPSAIETTLTVARNEWKYFADIETDYDASITTVPALRDELNQVVLNLVVNAAHAIADLGRAEKGHIVIRTRRDGAYVRIEVEDDGGGIPDAIRAKIFEPFFTTKEVGRGTGQGLYIVHNIVTKKHHGTIDMRTQVGVGTTFVVRLPLDPPRSSEPTERAA